MHCMRVGILLLTASLCLAADTSSPSVQPACPDPTAAASCGTAATSPAGAPSPAGTPAAVTLPSAKERKSARQAFHRGLKLEKSQDLDHAFREFEQAARLEPVNPQYLLAREMTREHLVGVHIDIGNADLLKGDYTNAIAEFRTALNIDPQNEFAQQRMQAAVGAPAVQTGGPVQVVASSDKLTTNPQPGLNGLHDIHYRGDSKGLLTTIAASYGLTVEFDDSFVSRRIRIDLDQVDFATAMRAAGQVTKSFVVPLEPTVLFAAADTTENHRVFDRMGLRSFYVPPSATAPADMSEVLSALRTIFEFKFVSLNTASSIITVRGPIGTLEAATRFLDQINFPQPEVLLDLQVLEVSHNYATNIGLHVPNQFHLFNIPAAALAAVGGQSIQTLINQLISSGGINQAGNTTIAALLSQLQGQGNSIFSQPLATFGGGLTLMGLSLDQLSAVLSLNESSVRTLNHVQLRASQGKEATFKLGERYPVLNASFSPLSNSSAIAGVLQNQSYTAPFPSVNYEDLGLTLKAKPAIHHNSDVGLELSLQFRALGGGTVNGIPIINNREFTGGVVLKEGEPAAIAGVVSESDQRSLDGLPTFAQIPGFGLLVSQHSHMENDNELLILLTPHIVQESGNSEPPTLWLTR